MTREDWPTLSDIFEDYDLRNWKVEHGYVRCDLLTCEALNNPVTMLELRDAYVHWRHHANLAGCSHGR